MVGVEGRWEEGQGQKGRIVTEETRAEGYIRDKSARRKGVWEMEGRRDKKQKREERIEVCMDEAACHLRLIRE
jgi:hypothetical protein